MRYLSVCSGIEAATVAWHHMGWQPVAFSDIEPFPSAVLAHHYPHVPNLGDMTKFEEWNLESVDLLVGGTPCQSFSVAGLRKGLADPRGNLMLTFLAIAQRHRPRWIVWENVPGVLSSNGGRDFGTFLGALGELGYGFAYRVLDAQWFGVAQRRRRVFVVGYLGNWRRAAAVLFERESVRRDTPPSREKGQETAQCLTTGVGKRYDAESETLPIAFHNRQDPASSRDSTNALGAKDNGLGIAYGIPGNWIGRAPENGGNAVEPMLDVAPCQTKTDIHAVAQPIPYEFLQITAPVNRQSRQPGDPCHTLARDNAAFATTMQPMAFKPKFFTRDNPKMEGAPNSSGTIGTLLTNDTGDNAPHVAIAMAVRRLTPVECERLQGFPDGYTNIPWRKKDEAPDGPRYKALGNSMAVPVMRWIGERIAKVDAQ